MTWDEISATLWALMTWDEISATLWALMTWDVCLCISSIDVITVVAAVVYSAALAAVKCLSLAVDSRRRVYSVIVKQINHGMCVCALSQMFIFQFYLAPIIHRYNGELTSIQHVHRYCRQYDSVSTSRLPSWYSSVWPARHLLIWPTTVSSPPMPVLADSAQPTRQSALAVVRTIALSTGALQLPDPDHVCGTRYHLT